MAAQPLRQNVLQRLSVLDRFLPLWIFLAMAVGIGKLFPDIGETLDKIKLDTVSLPIAIGLLWMMYPVLAKVKYEMIPSLAGNWKMSGTSLFLNWGISPALMFALAWLLLPDHPEYRTRLILGNLKVRNGTKPSIFPALTPRQSLACCSPL